VTETVHGLPTRFHCCATTATGTGPAQLSAATVSCPSVATRSHAPVPDGSAPVCVIVNLDARLRQAGWVELLADTESDYDVVDLLNGPVYRWRGGGSWNFVELDPAVTPAHIFRVGAGLRRVA